METYNGQDYLPGHVRARIRTFKHLAMTDDDRQVLIEMCKSHKTTDVLRTFSIGNLRQQMEAVRIRLERVKIRTKKNSYLDLTVTG